MTFAFHPKRPFTEDFRTVGEEQIERAIAILEGQPDGVHEAIHDARKSFKRLRSLYRLVAADAPLFQSRENARIRGMARSLATFRDAAALAENAVYLRQHAASEEQQLALDKICTILASRRDRIAEDEGDLDRKIEATIVNCRKAHAALAHVSFRDGRRKSARRLAKGLHRTLRRAARARTACAASADTMLFHDLRKSAQDYRMQLALLREAWPSAMRAKREEANELVDVLGHLNDLDALMSLVGERPELAGNSQEHLFSSVAARQDELRREALTRAEAVFLDRPRRESRALELLWLEAGK
ncbi:CHAD domain-containing protein [Mesorhizobium plurifarium]|uniref:CHAD domain-containing protein n=1 Tax=Sinorhizobium arboris TaxID=76745 RepID=UPI00040EB8ED|nr:CHAD domain-containing protein [Sinorhizobium arboris]PST18752.1 CHAD domain-containing protein [Mesorhizobium plurifarium]